MSQFLQQFRFDVRHKSGKEYIISNALSCLANATPTPTDPHYSELDALYIYNITLIEIHPYLVSRILAGYNSNPWWARLHQQIRSNHNLGVNAAALPFRLGFPLAKNADPYLASRPESSEPTNLAEDFAALKTFSGAYGPSIRPLFLSKAILTRLNLLRLTACSINKQLRKIEAMP